MSASLAHLGNTFTYRLYIAEIPAACFVEPTGQSDARIVIVIVAAGVAMAMPLNSGRPTLRHLNFARMRHYNFAPTFFENTMCVMLNEKETPPNKSAGGLVLSRPLGVRQRQSRESR
jgi:hypothetical protein